MISSFYDYAGAVGLASMAGWMLVLVITVVYAAGVRKVILCRVALVIAIAAIVLARMASATIGDIQATPALAVEDPERAKTIEGMSKRAANVRFAEDSSTDKLDVGGASTHELQVAGMETKVPDYDFRKRGKQQRDAGMSKSADKPDEASTQPAEAPPAPPRMLPEAEVFKANRLDDFNLFAVRVSIYIALLLVLIDYLRRFNQTFTRVLPLPLAGPFVDSVFPKAYSVYVTSKPGEARGEGVIKKFLERALLKRETFIYMGKSDPWADKTNLPRLLVCKVTKRIDKLVIDEATEEAYRKYAFETVWHGQGCAVAIGEDAGRSMLALTADFLADRDRNVEPAYRTVNIVWEFDAPPSEELINRLAKSCPTSNFRFFVVAPTPPAGAAKSFGEVYSARQIAI